MASDYHVIVLSKLENVVTLSVIKGCPGLGDWLHLAATLGRNQVIVRLGLLDIAPVLHTWLDVPVVDCSTNMDAETISSILQS